LAVREQTTVLFSTHILSDVERICTDVALLNDGVVTMQGKISDIKANYPTEKYRIEVEEEALQHITDQSIPILKIERIEPSLESLFMEVVAK